LIGIFANTKKLTYILNIETATKNCSVSLGKNQTVIDVIEYTGTGYSHAEKLHVFIQEILQKNKVQPGDLSAVSVSKGPGSYTGLRIGVSAAKGLAYALEIPLISVSTLASLAQMVDTKEDAYIIPLIDARRMEVYSAVYDNNYNLIRKVEANILEDKPFDNFLNEKKIIFVGDAVEKTQKVIQHPNAVFEKVTYPSALKQHFVAYKRFLDKKIENTAYFEPFYLKDFIITSKKLSKTLHK